MKNKSRYWLLDVCLLEKVFVLLISGILINIALKHHFRAYSSKV